MSSVLKLFANPALAAVLSIFLLNPDEELYQADIVKKARKALIQVQRALATLKEIGLISSVHRGRMVYYKALRDHPAFFDLKNLFLKTVALGDVVRLALQPLHDRIEFAFIFGSLASSEESASSDIDLFIVADLTLRELTKILTPLSTKLSRELNPVLFERSEMAKRILKKDHFLLQVLDSPKIWIQGDESSLRQLTGLT